MRRSEIDCIIADFRNGSIGRGAARRRVQALIDSGQLRDPPPLIPPFRATTRLQTAVIKKTEGRCWYCGDVGDSIDHQHPRTRGGADTVDNCVMACRSCNSKKARRTVEEFRIYMMLVRGRPPSPFHGEAAAPARDWLIVCDTPIHTESRRALFDGRMAGVHAGDCDVSHAATKWAFNRGRSAPAGRICRPEIAKAHSAAARPSSSRQNLPAGLEP